MPSIRPSTWAGTPGHHARGRRAEPLRPRSAAPGRGCRRCRRWSRSTAWARDLEVADRLAAARPTRGRRRRAPGGDRVRRSTAPAVDGELVDAVAERERHPAARHAARTRRSNGSTTPGAGAPGDVEARHRVAVAVGAPVAALGPADDREEPVTLLVQPRALLAGREVRRRPRPTCAARGPRRRSNCGRAHPVLQSRARRQSLMPIRRCSGLSTRNRPPKRPERLAAEGLLALLVDEHDPSCRASASSAVATSPARPAPTTTTSASMGQSMPPRREGSGVGRVA